MLRSCGRLGRGTRDHKVHRFPSLPRRIGISNRVQGKRARVGCPLHARGGAIFCRGLSTPAVRGDSSARLRCTLCAVRDALRAVHVALCPPCGDALRSTCDAKGGGGQCNERADSRAPGAAVDEDDERGRCRGCLWDVQVECMCGEGTVFDI